MTCFVLLSSLHAALAVEPVDREQEYRQHERPFRVYRSMEVTWTTGRVAAVAGPTILLGSYLFTAENYNRDPSDSGPENAGFTLGTAGAGLALAGPPTMVFGSLYALPSLKKIGATTRPTMGLVSLGFYAVSVGCYYGMLSSYESDPGGDTWKGIGVGGTVALAASGFFANSQVNNTKRVGKRLVPDR
jgi:hypothetical protein